MKKVVFVYGLVNPLNNRVFYVGATTKPLEVRLKQHINKMNSYSCKVKEKAWGMISRMDLLNKLKDKGLLFKIKLLEQTTFKDSSTCEKKWFEYYKSKHFKLFQSGTGDFKNQFSKKYYRNQYMNISIR